MAYRDVPLHINTICRTKSLHLQILSFVACKTVSEWTYHQKTLRDDCR
jgi:hypothetical protein